MSIPTCKHFSPEQQQSNMKEPQSNPEDDTDSEEELLAAAADWASSTGQVNHASTNNRNMYKRQGNQWSLHVTQISFEASDYCVRNFFSSHGCLVSSCRFVYDRGEGGKRKFRGVAFVDMADEQSFTRGLELHRSMLLNRRINVRATISPEELNRKVEATESKVAALMQKKNKPVSSSVTSNKKEGTKTRNTREDIPPKRKEKHQKKLQKIRKGANSAKYTKKERNRRAAIIASQKRKKRW